MMIINPIKKRCTQCGKEFVTDFDWEVTCSECLNKKWLSPKENSETIAKTDNYPKIIAVSTSRGCGKSEFMRQMLEKYLEKGADVSFKLYKNFPFVLKETEETPRVYCHHHTKIDTDNMDALCYSLKDIEIVKETYDHLQKENEIMENNKSKMKEYPFYGMAGISIKKVIFSKPVTTVIWSNNTKTQIRCQKGDKWDPEKALAMAICKKVLGNTPYFNNYFKKWLGEAKVEDPKKNKAEKKRKKEAAKKANKANT